MLKGLRCMFVPISLFFVLFALPARAAELEKPSRAEVIEEVSRFTGLTGDVLSLVHEENAQLFENVNHAVFAVKAINMVADAKDQEAAMEVVMAGVEFGLGKIKDKFLPVAMNGFLALAGVYKASLEIIRDYIAIPAFEEGIYQLYKQSRAADAKFGDTSEESRETAFAAATMNSASGYYMVKSKMFGDIVKKRDLNKDAMGDIMTKKVERQIDDFWIKRMETRYQLELLKEQKEKLKAETWKIVAKDVEAIRAAAAKPKPGKGSDGFFFSENNLPAGWQRWIDPARPAERANDFVVGNDKGAGLSFQRFFMVNSDYMKRTSKNKWGSPAYWLAGFPDETVAHPAQIEVSVSVRPRPDWAEQIKQQIKNKTLTVDLPGEGIAAGGCKGNTESRYYFQCNFVKGGWYVELVTWSLPAKQLKEWQESETKKREGKPGNYVDQTTTSLELTQQMAKIVAGKIPVAAKPK